MLHQFSCVHNQTPKFVSSKQSIAYRFCACKLKQKHIEPHKNFIGFYKCLKTLDELQNAQKIKR